VIGPQQNYLEEKQAWLWSLGDTYRIKDRPRYMSAFGGNSAMDTSSPNPLRYSVIGDNNNIEEEKEGEITQGDRLNEIKARRMQHHHPISSPHVNMTSSLTFDSSTSFKRANTTLNSTANVPTSPAGVRRSYVPVSNTPTNVLLNSTTRKPRSYISSATSMMKTPIYPTNRYLNTTTHHVNAMLTISDSDNRDPVSSVMLKTSQRGKSPMATNPNSFPTHSYYTRSKSTYSKY
jgi:hypothetical protein